MPVLLANRELFPCLSGNRIAEAECLRVSHTAHRIAAMLIAGLSASARMLRNKKLLVT
jgi:hypothetical protein